MTKRVALLLIYTLSLTLMTGCPGAGTALIGTWIFTIGSDDFGLILKPGGQTELYIAAGLLNIAGDIHWEANGSEFTMRQETVSDQFIYAGRIATNSSMSGGWVVWDGPNAGSGGTWSAVRQ